MIQLKSEADIFKPGWGNSFIQDASNIARMEIQKEKELSEKQAPPEPMVNPIDDEAERDRIMQELIEEEEQEKRSSTNSISKRKGKKKSK